MKPSPDDKFEDPLRALIDEVSVDRKAEVPIGTQLTWAIRSHIGDGRLMPGDRLPGLRELADSTGVNVNTVRAVYQRLEAQGLIDSQQGSGTFVAARPRRPTAANKIAAAAANEAREAGVDPREVAAALYTSPDEAPATADGAFERRRVLRAQIAALERTLAEMEAAYPGIAPVPVEKRSRGPILLGAEELERVRAELVKRLAAIQTTVDARGAGESDPPRRTVAAPERSSSAKAPARVPKRSSTRPATA